MFKFFRLYSFLKLLMRDPAEAFVFFLSGLCAFVLILRYSGSHSALASAFTAGFSSVFILRAFLRFINSERSYAMLVRGVGLLVGLAVYFIFFHPYVENSFSGVRLKILLTGLGTALSFTIFSYLSELVIISIEKFAHFDKH